MSIFPYRITTRRPSSMKQVQMDIKKTREAQEEMTGKIEKISDCLDRLCSDNSPIFEAQKKSSNWRVYV